MMWIEYHCEITDELDKLSKMGKYSDNGFFNLKHYILLDPTYKVAIPIRVPGGTIGSIFINKSNIITKISIDTNYVVKTYDDNVNEIINNKFVGTKFDTNCYIK